MKAASVFSHGRQFLDSGAIKSLINDSSMLSNMRSLPCPRMVIGLTGPKMIKYCGDLNLSMRNTSGEINNVVIKGVYYNLSSVSDMAKANYATTFSNTGNHIQGPEGTFNLIKTSGVCAFPSVADTQTADIGATSMQMSPEELMHLRLYHLVNYSKLEILSKSGARGISALKCSNQKCTTYTRQHHQKSQGSSIHRQ